MIPARRRRSTVLFSAAFARSGVAFANLHHAFKRLAFIFVEVYAIKYVYVCGRGCLCLCVCVCSGGVSSRGVSSRSSRRIQAAVQRAFKKQVESGKREWVCACGRVCLFVCVCVCLFRRSVKQRSVKQQLKENSSNS